LDNKLVRIIFIIPVILIITLVLGTFCYSITAPIFFGQHDQSLKKSESSDLFSESFVVSGFSNPTQACCGHVDVTGPSILLISPENNSNNPIGTILDFDVTDDNPMEDFKPEQVLYQWNHEVINTTFISPYDLILPDIPGSYILTVFAKDVQGNWSMLKFRFTVVPSILSILLLSPSNNTVNIGGTTLEFDIITLPPSVVIQTLYHWDNELTNSTLITPFKIILPSEDRYYILTIFVQDNDSNWITERFSFTVDNTPPEINSPLDINYNVGDSGNYIFWQGTDLHPGVYIVWKDGVLLTGRGWTSSQIIEIEIDGLTEGSYNYTIEIGDIVGNSNFDTVIITVLKITTENDLTTTPPELTGGFYFIIIISGFIGLAIITRINISK
jgi:hypothetical protein